MANPDVVRGLRPVRYTSGAPYNGAANIYSVQASDGTAIFIGDIVTTVSVGTAQTINGNVYLDVVQFATGNVQTGVVVGVLPSDRDSLNYRAASTQRLLLVADCLLYTSPSPRDGATSRMPSSA